MTTQTPKDSNDLKVELVKAAPQLLKWGLVAIVAAFLMFVLCNPLKNQLPGILASMTAITLGGLSISLDQRLEAQASPEVRDALRGLSPEAISELFRISTTSIRNRESDFNSSPKRSALEALEKKELITIERGVSCPSGLARPSEIADGATSESQQNEELCVRWRATDTGVVVSEFMHKLLLEILREPSPSEGE